MSFVICVCGYDFSIMMADGRLVEYPNKNKIVAEKVIKVRQINKNVMVGFAGDPLPAENAVDELLGDNHQNLYVTEARELLVQKLETYTLNSLGVKMILSGKDSNGNFLIDIIDSKQNYKSTQFYPSLGGIACSYAGNNPELCKTIVHDNLENKSFLNLCELETAMKSCIKEVAEHDNTVNTNILKVMIV